MLPLPLVFALEVALADEPVGTTEPAVTQEPVGAPTPEKAPDADVVLLTDGTRHEGRLLDSFAGAYWLQLAEGRVLKLPYATVASATRADGSAAPAPTDPTATDPTAADPAPPGAPICLGGFDLGTSVGGRLRWDLGAPTLHVLEARFGFLPVMSEGIAPAFVHGLSLSFGSRGRVHPEVSFVTGLAIVPWALPTLGVGGGLVVDPPGPFEAHAGLLVGTMQGDGTASPELHASWLR